MIPVWETVEKKIGINDTRCDGHLLFLLWIDVLI